MKGHGTIPTPGLKSGVLRSRPVASRRRFLLIAVGLSVAVHLAALFVVFSSRIVPKEDQPQGAIELLMVEKKGAKPSQAGRPSDSPPTPPQPKETEAPKKVTQQPPADASHSIAPPPTSDRAGDPATPRTDETPPKDAKPGNQPETQQASTQPTAPTSQEAPVFDLAGTESESNATVLGGRVLPARPDDRFRNRPPVYPRGAAMRGDHGAVVVRIHVSETGFATGVDVLESSGVTELDQAAVAAVRKWRFRPAMQAGRTVPFDMAFRFVFDAL